jgi:ubiquinone/menaquinone biosynthesis C-methylase UbiE
VTTETDVAKAAGAQGAGFDDVAQFDRWSERYERSKWQWLFFDRMHRIAIDLAARFGEPRAILDVGCGTGRLLRAAHARWPNARLVGVDPSPGMVESGKRLTPAEFHLAGAEAMPVPDASFDLAFSTIAFHHWTDPDTGLREVARSLRAGGHFVLIDNIGPDWVARYLKDRPYFTRDERVGVWARNGLRVLRQRLIINPSILPIPLATVAVKETAAPSTS